MVAPEDPLSEGTLPSDDSGVSSPHSEADKPPDAGDGTEAESHLPTESDSFLSSSALADEWAGARPSPAESMTAAAQPDATAQATHGTGEAFSGRSPRYVHLLGVYAILVTVLLVVALVFLIKGTSRTNPLESLPDIPPERTQDLTYIAPDRELPKGHSLRLGESRRFGNILVEPLSVLRAPLAFEHFQADSGLSRPPTSPVWQLRLRFTNVSDDQSIAPLDVRLLSRHADHGAQGMVSNFYLVNAVPPRQIVAPQYPLSPTSEWNLHGQRLGKVLQPGESCEMFLACDPAVPAASSLPRLLLWRFQFRKGYSSAGHGVTTIAEVAFLEREIQSDEPPRR